MQIISLDLETSGLIPGKHVPLSIGAVSIDSKNEIQGSFYTRLKWESLVVDPAALAINKLDITKGDSVRKALQDFSSWLGYFTTPQLTALGKNVGSFDLPMLRSVWKVDWPFSYRSIDLNSLFFALSNIYKRDMKEEITEITAIQARKHCGFTEHHALFDALWNVYAWKECLKWFQKSN